MNRLALLALALLCSACTAQKCAEISENRVGKALVGLVNGFFLGAPCSNGPDEPSDPETLHPPMPGPCAVEAGENACVIQAKTECCGQATACIVESSSCACLAACRSAGNTAERCSSQCDAKPDELYENLAACATACGRLR